ncbi:MAG: AAA family ATPase [Armatimonadetes bacterium]|nr:AAA family ATPase [Armatimonadota bacterium]
MLHSLTLINFTAFVDAEFKFASGLNVIVGENGAGKTHILKAAYCCLNVEAKGSKESSSPNPTKSYFQTSLARKFNAVFKPDELGRLVNRQRQGRQRCEVSYGLSADGQDLTFSLHTASKSEVTVDKIPSAWLEKIPVYLPTRELLTIYPGFVSLYETTHLSFDETWRDTCVLLGAPLARGQREKTIKDLLKPLEEAMGGSVLLDSSGRFYLVVEGVNMEMHLVAEGLRKLAMIARLIATGSLTDKGFLFWDEPEANLNPKIVKTVAHTILSLCQSGIQVFIATHSLFLMRELDILLQSEDFKGVEARFFGLHRGETGVRVEQGDSVDDIGGIDALDEELMQSDRYLKAGER